MSFASMGFSGTLDEPGRGKACSECNAEQGQWLLASQIIELRYELAHSSVTQGVGSLFQLRSRRVDVLGSFWHLIVDRIGRFMDGISHPFGLIGAKSLRALEVLGPIYCVLHLPSTLDTGPLQTRGRREGNLAPGEVFLVNYEMAIG